MSKILLTTYMKKMYTEFSVQKHFVLCDATPALHHFFYAKSSFWGIVSILTLWVMAEAT